MPDFVHLIKVPLRPERLAALAKARRLPVRDLDDGYLCHCLLRELWQEMAPAPFVIRSRGRTLDVWGYSSVSAGQLVDNARAFGDPSLLMAIADLDLVASKPVPQFEPGRRVGFSLRACPVVRLAKSRNGHRAGAEIDAFLARCFAAGSETMVSREDVYRDWLTAKLDLPATGVTVGGVHVVGVSREHLVRRTQGSERQANRLERPEVWFEGDLVVTDGAKFVQHLAHGVGRHRAFGFGALMLMPPGTSRTA